jgi:SAM-dependent methyltransferase
MAKQSTDTLTEAHRRVRASYDAVAEPYATAYGDELDHNPLHRGIIDCFVSLCSMSGLDGPIGDVGCGPGHIAAYLAERGLPVVAMDLSPRMADVARRRYPGLDVCVGSMTSLDVADEAWAGLVAVYSIIHLPPDDRSRAYREFARVLRPGAWILVAFHIESATMQAGESIHFEEFLGQPVDLDGYFLSSAEVTAGLSKAGFEVQARFEREPVPDIEYPSRRSYLLGRRRS